MAKRISSMNELIQKLSKAEYQLEENLSIAVGKSAEKVKETTEAKFGHYQPGVGGFPAWKKLAERTIKAKLRYGGQEDPLIGYYKTGSTTKKKVTGKLRSKTYNGKLMNSFKIKHQGLVAVVGTDDPVSRFHEFGTINIPPRPFLRPALHQEQSFIKTEFKKAILKTLKNL